MGEVLRVCLPALAVTAVPVAAGRIVRRRLATRGRLVALASLLVICAAIGVSACLQSTAEVPASQAVTAGLLAGIGVLVPLGLFFAIGYGFRSAAATALAWFVASLPIATYAFFLVFALAAAENCPPGAYECPV